MAHFDWWWSVAIALLGLGTYWARRHSAPSYSVWSSLFWMAVAILMIRSFFWEGYSIEGHSMHPTITNQSLVVVNKQAYGLVMPVFHYQNARRSARAHEVIAFRHGSEVWIKRVAAQRGDHVSFDGSTWFVNNVPVGAASPHSLLWVSHGGFPDNRYYMQMVSSQVQVKWKQHGAFDVIVPPGFVFVLGDNPGHSTDSRDIGLVSMSQVLGQVIWMHKKS